jgi:RNA polymerase sigma-70 factor, ECF subfamily
MEIDAYRRHVLAHKDRLYGYAAYLLDDLEEAKDVTQEALVRLWQHRTEMIESRSIRAWLLQTTHRLCIDRLRARGLRTLVDPESLDALPSAGARAPDDAAADRELGGAITWALQELSPRDRSVLLMREVHGLSYAEMAKSLGMPLGTLKAFLHRAREKLRRRLVSQGVRP